MSHKTFSMIGCGDVQSGNSWSKKRIATLPTVSYYHLHSIATTFFFLADFFLSFSFLCCLYIISRPMHKHSIATNDCIFLILRLVNYYHLHPIARDFPPLFLQDLPSLICPPSYLRRAAPEVSISWNKMFTLTVGFRLRIGAMQINHREFVKMVPPSNHPGSNASQWLVTTFWQFLPDSIQNRE